VLRCWDLALRKGEETTTTEGIKRERKERGPQPRLNSFQVGRAGVMIADRVRRGQWFVRADSAEEGRNWFFSFPVGEGKAHFFSRQKTYILILDRIGSVPRGAPRRKKRGRRFRRLKTSSRLVGRGGFFGLKKKKRERRSQPQKKTGPCPGRGKGAVFHRERTAAVVKLKGHEVELGPGGKKAASIKEKKKSTHDKRPASSSEQEKGR